MLYDIFTNCAVDKKPRAIAVWTEKELLDRQPVVAGSRSGPDGEYGLVSVKDNRFLGVTQRQVYIRLTKDHARRLRELNLSF